jgi:hypothetical protein
MALCRQDKDHDDSQAAKTRLLDIVPPVKG